MKNKQFFIDTEKAAQQGLEVAVADLLERDGTPVKIDIFKQYPAELNEEVMDKIGKLNSIPVIRDSFKNTRADVKLHFENTLREIIDSEPAFVTGHQFELTEGDLDVLMDYLFSEDTESE